MSRNELETDVQRTTVPTPGSSTGASLKAPVPAPPRADAALAAADGLTDHTDELAEIGRMPLEERASALASIHEQLASVLHEAEG